MTRRRPLTVPSSETLAAKIRALQEELRALKRLHRLAHAAELAERAAQERQGMADAE